MPTSELPPLPRTLILDYYDSYTNNLLTLFTQLYSDDEVLRKVVVVKADRYTWDEFRTSVLPNIDCLILSPGPGRPDNTPDIGFALDLLRLHPIPILGVCLGHQAIGVAFGGEIINTPRITHGHVVPVKPIVVQGGLFTSDTEFDAVVYNSLTVDPISFPDVLEVTAHGPENTIQGLRHRDHPIWGVQYHPESISSTHGKDLLLAFLDKVHNHHQFSSTYPPLTSDLLASCAYRVASSSSRSVPPSRPSSPPHSESSSSSKLAMVEHRFGALGKHLKTSDVFERVVWDKGKGKAVGEIWLDGQTPTRPTTTSLAAPSFMLTYTLVTRTITLHTPHLAPQHQVLEEETFWDWFSDAQESTPRMLEGRKQEEGFKGGWIGWMGYEMKQESLAGYRRPSRQGDSSQGKSVDACWAWCNSVLERTKEGEWIARGVVARDGAKLPTNGTSKRNGHGPEKLQGLLDWLEHLDVPLASPHTSFTSQVNSLTTILSSPSSTPLTSPAASFPSFRPTSDPSSYLSSIESCRESIRQGESYELTLTTSFTSTLPPPSSTTSPYAMYLRLRERNPAYYSAYLSFPSISTHILSSSPERFLKVDARGEVEMMPIKGTRARVKPGQCVCQPGRGCGGADKGSMQCVKEGVAEDARRGEELSRDKKERAENLMIVDLIRSDLLSCCTPSTVTVPKLIALESYGVHNLVTTVRGRLARNVGPVEAVRRCFPPGSMTGAPKLRSVQILEGLEGAERQRGVYSGCLGYVSVDGVVDLSVVIRTIVVTGDQMSLGAGGAITWLSEKGQEWEEVKTKVRSVVGELND